MARFGRGIVEQLTNPAFGRGMFDLGQKIGGMPAQAREEKKKKSEKAALIDVENQLRQVVAVGAEAARTGNVDLISNQINSINEQLKTEDNDEKRQRLTDTYKVLTQNLTTARGVQEAGKSQIREADMQKAIRGGKLSSADGNDIGISTAQMRLAKLLEVETDEGRRSQIFTAIDNLDTQLKTVDATKAANNIQDLIKAEALYKRLESEGESRANIIANADPESDEYLRAKNESIAMQGIKQRIDQLRKDPNTVKAVKDNRINTQIDELTKKETLLTARKNQMLEKLRSTKPNTKEWNDLVSTAKKENLGGAVNSAISELQDAELKRIELLDAQASRRPLSKEEKQELADINVSVEGLSSAEARRRYTLFSDTQIKKKVDLATRPLDIASDARINSVVKTTLNNLVEDAELEGKPFFQDLSDKVEILLENPEEIEIIKGFMDDKTGSELTGAIEKYIKGKFPKKFEEYEQARSNKNLEAEEFGELLADEYRKDPDLDPEDPSGVDQEIAISRANKELRQAIIRAKSEQYRTTGRGRMGGPM